MIERTGDPVALPATEQGTYEVLCPVHNLTFHGPLGDCPECVAEAPQEQERRA